MQSEQALSLEQCVFNFIRLYNEKVTRQFADTYRDTFTAVQFFTLATLKEYGVMTMSMLGDRMGMQKQQTTKVVNQLEELGYLYRIHDKQDRRIVKIDLTEQARAYLERFSQENLSRLGALFGQLSEQDLAEFRQALSVLNRILAML